MMRHQRGQVLPMWAMGTIATLVLTFLALNYANAVRFQVRAQNAADSAAQAVVAIQAERWNLMTETLYASNVEEYRMRRMLDAMLLSINYSGGCSAKTGYIGNNPYPGGNELAFNFPLEPTKSNPYLTTEFFAKFTDEGTCSRAYTDFHSQFTRSFNRYTNDIKYLNDVTALATYDNWQKDANSLLVTLATDCNGVSATAKTLHADGGDCAFKYTMPGSGYRTGLASVAEDAQKILVPGLKSRSTVYPDDYENKQLFAPVKVDIVTCRIVPPLIPSFGPFKLKPTYAIGRAAATNVQIEQDWFDPGALDDPLRAPGVVFQPPEPYTQSSADDTGQSSSAYDWYNVDYGGNPTTAYSAYGVFAAPVTTDELSARFGWWNAIPVTPFAGPVDPAKVC
ncbi:MAG: Tad domain-containing protein [Candidatus Eremiobacteraeota bacterium]|nr:Tad domain-containing protein [Candidatus Eremiobacteraeota bacterium]